jgi:hypothetical protein
VAVPEQRDYQQCCCHYARTSVDSVHDVVCLSSVLHALRGECAAISCLRFYGSAHCRVTQQRLQTVNPRLLLLCAFLCTQIDYSTVFFFEYFGPLVIYPLFFFLPQIFYPGQK